MILYFDDAIALTGARIIPRPLILVYPSAYTLKLQCMTGYKAQVPVDIESLGCTEWQMTVRTGFNTSAITLIRGHYDASCVSGNEFTIQLSTCTLPVYTWIAGRRKALVVFCLKGFKPDTGCQDVAICIQFLVSLQSTGDDIQPPQAAISYNELGDLPSIEGVTVQGQESANHYNLVARTPNMPTATADMRGAVYIYTGENTAQYRRGHIYMVCVQLDGTVAWEDITDAGNVRLDYDIVDDSP